MDDDFKTGYWMANDAEVHIVLGWVPDFVMVIIDKVTDPHMLYWQSTACQAADGSALLYFGWTMAHAAATDNLEKTLTGDGIQAYDISTELVNVLSPVPERGKLATTVNAAADAVAWAVPLVPVARTLTAIGTIVRPSIKNGFVYECTTLVGGANTEPAVWGTVLGG